MIKGDFILIPSNIFYSSYYALGVIALEPDVSQIHSKIVFNLWLPRSSKFISQLTAIHFLSIYTREFSDDTD